MMWWERSEEMNDITAINMMLLEKLILIILFDYNL